MTIDALKSYWTAALYGICGEMVPAAGPEWVCVQLRELADRLERLARRAGKWDDTAYNTHWFDAARPERERGQEMDS